MREQTSTNIVINDFEKAPLNAVVKPEAREEKLKRFIFKIRHS